MSGPGDRVYEEGPMGSGFSEIQRQNGDYHRTLYDRNSNNHISWDTNNNGDYKNGSGHEDSDNHIRNQWD